MANRNNPASLFDAAIPLAEISGHRSSVNTVAQIREFGHAKFANRVSINI
jgi:hypothetical protein